LLLSRNHPRFLSSAWTGTSRATSSTLNPVRDGCRPWNLSSLHAVSKSPLKGCFLPRETPCGSRWHTSEPRANPDCGANLTGEGNFRIALRCVRGQATLVNEAAAPLLSEGAKYWLLNQVLQEICGRFTEVWRFYLGTSDLAHDKEAELDRTKPDYAALKKAGPIKFDGIYPPIVRSIRKVTIVFGVIAFEESRRGVVSKLHEAGATTRSWEDFTTEWKNAVDRGDEKKKPARVLFKRHLKEEGFDSADSKDWDVLDELFEFRNALTHGLPLEGKMLSYARRFGIPVENDEIILSAEHVRQALYLLERVLSGIIDEAMREIHYDPLTDWPQLDCGS